MELPPSVLIGGKTYEITTVPEGDCYGMCDFDIQTITIRDGCHPQQRLDTVLHEIIHGIIYEGDLYHAIKKEEALVRPLASSLTAVLLNNPALMAFINASLNHPPR
jgi:hypothetical protein